MLVLDWETAVCRACDLLCYFPFLSGHCGCGRSEHWVCDLMHDHLSAAGGAVLWHTCLCVLFVFLSVLYSLFNIYPFPQSLWAIVIYF